MEHRGSPLQRAGARYLGAVSAENVEIVRRVVGRLNQGDIDGAIELFAPEAEMDWSRRLLDPVVVRGHEGVRQVVDQIFEIFSEARVEEEELIDRGEVIILVGEARFQGRSSEAPVKARATTVWTVRDGKIVRFELFQTKEDALEALARPK
jgi:ketosteroid isomerase-like protein